MSNIASNIAKQLLLVGRRLFRDTWIHRLPVTVFLYDTIARRIEVPDVVTFRGVELAVASTDCTITPTLVTGTFEQVELDAFEALLTPGMTVVDVGANIGTHTALAARAIGESGTILSIEAVESNVKLLSKTIDLNAAEDNVIVEHCAAGAGGGSVRIYLDGENSGTHSAGKPGDDWIDVPIHGVDELVMKHNLEQVDLIKIDVEGYESHVLEGATATLRNDHPLVFCEFDNDMLIDAGGSPERVVEILDQHGSIYIIHESTGAIEPISSRDLLSFKERHKRLVPQNVIVVPTERAGALAAV